MYQYKESGCLDGGEQIQPQNLRYDSRGHAGLGGVCRFASATAVNACHVGLGLRPTAVQCGHAEFHAVHGEEVGVFLVAVATELNKESTLRLFCHHIVK